MSKNGNDAVAVLEEGVTPGHDRGTGFFIGAVKKLYHLNRMGRIEGPPLSGVLLLAGAALSGGTLTGDIWIAAFAMAAICMNYVYLVNGATDTEEDSVNSPNRPLVSGHVSQKEAWVWVYFLFALSVVYPFFVHSTWSERILVWLVLAMGYFYSMPPVRFKRYPPLATIYLVINFNVPLVLGYMMAGGSNEIPPFLVATIALFTANMPLKDYGDRVGDKAAGIANWANMIGTTGLLVMSSTISVIGAVLTAIVVPPTDAYYWGYVLLPLLPALNIAVHKLLALDMDQMFTRGVRALIIIGTVFVVWTQLA